MHFIPVEVTQGKHHVSDRAGSAGLTSGRDPLKEQLSQVGAMAQSGPATPSALYKMISIPEAQDAVLAETQSLPSTSVGLADADGHILAEDVKAPEHVPPFPASIKVCVY